MVAQIAYASLDGDRSRAVVDSIAKGADGSDVQGFVESALWADLLKVNDLHAFDPWHYINSPYVQDGVLPPPLPSTNLQWALKEMFDAFRAKQASVESRSFALRMLAHLVGDSMQPMHAVTLFNKQFPTGDMGGNLFTLLYDGKDSNLHSFWDSGAYQLDGRFSNPITEAQWGQLRSKADTFMTRWPRSQFSNATLAFEPSTFLAESYTIGVASCYLNGTLPYRAAFTATSDYTKNSYAIIEQRIVMGGYRLAAAIQSVVDTVVLEPSSSSHTWIVVVTSLICLAFGAVLGAVAVWYYNKRKQKTNGYSVVPNTRV